MVQGMLRDAWDESYKTILVRYVLLYLCGTGSTEIFSWILLRH